MQKKYKKGDCKEKDKNKKQKKGKQKKQNERNHNKQTNKKNCQLLQRQWLGMIKGVGLLKSGDFEREYFLNDHLIKFYDSHHCLLN